MPWPTQRSLHAPRGRRVRPHSGQRDEKSDVRGAGARGSTARTGAREEVLSPVEEEGTPRTATGYHRWRIDVKGQLGVALDFLDRP